MSREGVLVVRAGWGGGWRMWVSVGSSWLSTLSPEAHSEGSCHRAEPRHPRVEVESARPIRTTQRPASVPKPCCPPP